MRTLNDDNNKLRSKLNIDAWHKAGYYGERVAASTGEVIKENDFPKDDVVFYGLTDANGSPHGIDTANVFLEIAPKATLYSIPTTLTKEAFRDAVSRIKEKDICISFESRALYSDDFSRDSILSEVVRFNTYFMGIGNEYTENFNKLAINTYIYGVGACRLLYDEFVTEGYSSRTDYVDFMGLSGWYVPVRFTGTSASGPAIAGMCALVNDLFIHKTGLPLSSKMMYQFIKDHCVDIDNPGKDVNTGHGIFILPNPEDVDVFKYGGGNILDKFKDKEQISEWATDAVAYCVSNGLLQGKGDIFDPKTPITREEQAVLVKRLVEFVNR